MDMEQLETLIEPEKAAKDAGYLSYGHFLEFRWGCIQGLRKFSDAFGIALGEALNQASDKDSRKIMRYWHQECEQAVLMWRIQEAKV